MWAGKDLKTFKNFDYYFVEMNERKTSAEMKRQGKRHDGLIWSHGSEKEKCLEISGNCINGMQRWQRYWEYTQFQASFINITY